MAIKKNRGVGEFKVTKTLKYHPDALAALDRMENKFKTYYGKAARKMMASFGLLHLEKTIKAKGLKPGDDIEAALEI